MFVVKAKCKIQKLSIVQAAKVTDLSKLLYGLLRRSNVVYFYAA